MSLNILGITDEVVSDAMQLGVFDKVNAHEPKVAPGNGVQLGVWADRVEPVASSGLSSSTARVQFNVRVYGSMLSEPQDSIDPNLIAAVDALIGRYIGGFTLNGLIRSVDVRGAHGPGLYAQAGYIQQDNRMYRVFTIYLPLIINDVWTETP